LALSAEDGFLLSRIDGTTSVMGLSHVTGLPLSQVQEGLRRLRASGALDVDPVGATSAPGRPSPRTTAKPPMPTTSRSPVPARATVDDDEDLFSDTGDDARADGGADGGDDTGEDADHDLDAGAAADLPGLHDDLPPLEGDSTLEGEAIDDGGDDEARPPERAATASPRQPHARSADHDETGAPDADPSNDDDEPSAVDEEAVDQSIEDEPDHDLERSLEGDADASDDPDAGEDAEAAAVEENNHRKLFETTLHPLPAEEREQLAKTTSGPPLLALCFDPLPQVIGGIFENPQCGFPHARLVACHHRTPQGLDDVLRRAEFARDAQVQRHLLGNPMLNDAQLKRLLSPKRLDVVYKIALSRDLPEKNRAKVRLILRSKWSTADGEARAHLVFSTEGRALTLLVGLPFDSQTTTLLCARPYNSLVLIQNLARFSSTPPPVLQHLMKQPLVKRTPHVRTLIAQHQNCPADVKRKLREM
jgi:hypothetical protein